MGPILAPESSIESNYRVLDTIFKDQLGLDPSADFAERLFLVYGDQKTARLLRSCKRERAESSSAFDSCRWLLPLPGLWHLRLNFLYLIMKTHFGGEGCAEQYSALYTHMNHLGRRNIPADKAPFHHMEELILHSFDARINALLLHRLHGKCDTKRADIVEHFLCGLDTEAIAAEVAALQSAVFGFDISREANSARPADAGKANKATPSQSATGAGSAQSNVDEEFLNHIRYLQIVETYKTLRYAIKHGDIGLLKRIIPRICVYFASGANSNYLAEMLNLWQLVSTDTCKPALQRAILANGFVNNQGKADTFFEVDRLNELLNLELKSLLRARGNSTFNVETIFKSSVSTLPYTAPLRTTIERAFRVHINNAHTVKGGARMEILSLADAIALDSIVRRQTRSVAHYATALLQVGAERLIRGTLEAFNQRSFEENPLFDHDRQTNTDDVEELAILSVQVGTPCAAEITLMLHSRLRSFSDFESPLDFYVTK